MSVRPDHHDSGFELAQRTGLAPDQARRMIIRAVARTHPALDPLRARISDLLDAQ